MITGTLTHEPASCTVDGCTVCDAYYATLRAGLAMTPRLMARLQPGYYWYFPINAEPAIVSLTKEHQFDQDVWTVWFTGSEIDVTLADALMRGSLGRRVKPPTR